MSPALAVDTFRLDTAYDRDRADPGTPSRYGNYLRFEAATFASMRGDYDDPTVPFTALAWRVATGPVMAPPLVQYPRRVNGVRLERNDWDGTALLRVDLITGRPPALEYASTSDGRRYRSWPTGFSGNFEPIGDREASVYPFLLTSAEVLLPVPTGTLPRVRGDDLYKSAIAGVRALVRLLNREIGPLLEKLGTP